MKLTEVIFRAGMPVEGYGPGFFRLGQEVHEGPLLILPDGVADWAGLDDLTPLIAGKDQFDILLIGTGAEISALPTAVRETLESAALPFDVMASPPALRTYNVLLAEERRVALAALPA